LLFRYPDDPELTFETLSTNSFETVELWDEEQKNAKDGLQHTLFALTSLHELAAEIYGFKEEASNGVCDAIPTTIPPLAIPNPAYIICRIVKTLIGLAFYVISIATKCTMTILQAAIYGMEAAKDPVSKRIF
jgi:hypothetical protein